MILKFKKKKFHHHEGAISIKNKDVKKIVICDKIFYGKNGLNILFATKMLKKLDLYVYFSYAWLQIEKTLMKLNI